MTRSPHDFAAPDCLEMCYRFEGDEPNEVSVVYKAFELEPSDIDSGLLNNFIPKELESKLEPGMKFHPVIDLVEGKPNSAGFMQDSKWEVILSDAHNEYTLVDWDDLQQMEKFSVLIHAHMLYLYRYEELNLIDPGWLIEKQERDDYEALCEIRGVEPKAYEEEPFQLLPYGAEDPAFFNKALRHGPVIDGLYGKPGDMVFVRGEAEEGTAFDRVSKPFFIAEYDQEKSLFTLVDAVGNVCITMPEELTRNYRGGKHPEDWE